MPELPEVETIRRDLEKHVLDKQLLSIEVFEPRLLQNCSPVELKNTLCDRTLTALKRRGKFLIFEFGPYSAVIHLRMSGWFSRDAGAHTRMIMDFAGALLYFDDTRRFGTLHLLKTEMLESQPPLATLGLEPLAASFTARSLETLSTSREVKQLLLDQTKIAGLGNIYVCEALHQAKIHPQQRANLISKKKLSTLREAIQTILQNAIDHQGSTLGDSVGDYRTLSGARGKFQDRFCVYGREGEGCFACGAPIGRIVQAGRSSFFCPVCQKM